MSRDPVDLAEAFLDGELGAAEWESARAADRERCAGALAAARARRAALAGLARPPLPAAVRQRILAATSAALAPTQTMTAGRPWWRYALPMALAAGLLLAVALPMRSAPRDEAQTAPAVARRDEVAGDGLSEGRTSGPATAQATSERAAANAVMSAPPSELAKRDSKETEAALADQAGTEGLAEISALAGVPASPASPAPATALIPGAATPAPSPIALQLAWRSPMRSRAVDDAPRQPVEIAGETDRAQETAGSMPATPGATTTESTLSFPVPPAVASDAVSAGSSDGDGDRELLVTLLNQTVGDLRVAPGGIRLIGVGGDGRAVWRTTLRSDSETVVPAGRSLSWVQPIAVLPPGVARLRLEVDGQRSTDIAP